MESTSTADSLRELARDILDHAGASPTNAAIVAESLVEANLRGHDSHGVLRLTRYVQFIDAGTAGPDRRTGRDPHPRRGAASSTGDAGSARSPRGWLSPS